MGEVAIFGKITDQTDKVRVYVYEDETLKIQNASGIIFQKTYRREGKKTISIPLQKAGTKLEFIVTGTSGFFDYSARIVKDTGTISYGTLSRLYNEYFPVQYIHFIWQ